MKAVRFHQARDIRVEEVAPPGQPRPGNVVVAPEWVGICGTDLHEYTDGPIIIAPESARHPLTGAGVPQILGHEFSATVVEVGPGVAALASGDRVSVMPQVSCGKCTRCVRGDRHLCVVIGCTGLNTEWGGLAELAEVPAYQLTRVPDGMSMERAALVEPTAVAVYALERAGLAAGKSVFVSGAGPIGVLCAMVALSQGASAVYVASRNPRRALRARDAGAIEVWDPTATDVAGEVADVTKGTGVDIAIECAGTESSLKTCVEAVRPGGVLVPVGLFTRPVTVDLNRWLLKDLRIEALVAYPTGSWPSVFDAMSSGLPVEQLITSRLSLDQSVGGFDSLVSPGNDEMKVLIHALS